MHRCLLSVKSIYPNPFDLVLDRLRCNSIASRSRENVETIGILEEDTKTANDKMYKNAVKHMEKYCQKYFYQWEKLGEGYKNIYKISRDEILKKFFIIDLNSQIESLKEAFSA